MSIEQDIAWPSCRVLRYAPDGINAVSVDVVTGWWFWRKTRTLVLQRSLGNFYWKSTGVCLKLAPAPVWLALNNAADGGQ